MKKVIALLLAVTTMVTVFAGCQSSGASTSSASSGTSSSDKPYNITMMYFVPTEGADFAKVEKAISDLALKEINMTVDLVPVSIGAYTQQAQLMLSGGEPLDILPMMPTSYTGYLANGYLVDMSKLIDQYGKDIIKQFNSEAEAKVATVNGFMYGIPTFKEFTIPMGICMRKDIMDECGIKKEDIKSYDDLTAVFAKDKAKHPEMDIMVGTKDQNFVASNTSFDNLNDYLGVLMDGGQSTKVENLYETDFFKSLATQMRQWYNAGYVKKDMATTQDAPEAQIKAGNAFSFECGVKPNTAIEKAAMTGYQMEVVQLCDPIKTTMSIATVTYGIAHNSKDPAKAMQFLNWCYSSPEFMNLLNWGIEGDHYMVTDKNYGVIDYPEGVTAATTKYHCDYGWAMPNQFIGYIWNGNPKTIWEDYKKFNDSAKDSKALGFIFDSSSVSNEIASLTSVQQQYLYSIATGSVDVDSTLAQFNKALYDAGLQKVIDAKQSQLDNWLKAKK